MVFLDIPEMKKWQEEERDIDRRNERLLKAIKSVKGEKFYNEILYEIQESQGMHGLAEIVREPVGIFQSYEDDDSILPGIYVDQTTDGGYSGDSFAGTICIEIKPGRFLKFYYSM